LPLPEKIKEELRLAPLFTLFPAPCQKVCSGPSCRRHRASGAIPRLAALIIAPDRTHHFSWRIHPRYSIVPPMRDHSFFYPAFFTQYKGVG
jgi:hypothetical protein